MQLTTAVEVRASLAAAWELLIDTRRWPEWGPSIIGVESTERCIGPRTTGRVRTAIGLWLPFRITHFISNEQWRWRVAGIPATGHRVEPVAPDMTRVIFEVPLLAAPYLVVCRLAAQRIKTILEEVP
ncbi:SRPBCC family protein [Desulfobulbus alkaliphilus]|uniref:SRPBCC family protein n=1 Tax=Desulfobulbus alkaliphilus TaxID=869814 RepID=UPI0019656EF7|nr:SRPBCC family protein [Desulfobulbus alkaliphilus]MBM9536198.1 SRPBCC family protein [Desulfobulbus alkaliphilus]